MTPKKTKPEGGGHRTQVPKRIKPSDQFTARSTAVEAQRQRILSALRRRPQTTEDLRKIGIFQAAARIKELRDRFHFSIETVRVTVVDRESYSHPRAALYVLHEPKGAV
jgi:hypothetical protein